MLRILLLPRYEPKPEFLVSYVTGKRILSRVVIAELWSQVRLLPRPRTVRLFNLTSQRDVYTETGDLREQQGWNF
jgi:hypothetical protein